MIQNDNRFEIFATSIVQISRSLQKLKMKEMSAFGLRSSHVMCLFFLHQSEEGMTAAEISESSELDKGAVSRTVAELERLGLVLCERPESEEKRKYRAKIVLTEEGHKIAQKTNFIIEMAVDEAGNGLTPEEREIFYKGLVLIASNLHRLSESDTTI